tara:strand:- start:951 stop:1535 length:585 start_codon:yes stop_codon:yes gene_type:complete
MKKILFILCFIFSLTTSAQLCNGPQGYLYSPFSSPGLPMTSFVPGQVVVITFNLGSYNQINSNWIHAFEITLGPGWTNLTPITPPPNPGGSPGNWLWDLQHTFIGGLNFGPGWRFVNNGNAGWGTSSTGPFSMSFEVTVGPTCLPSLLNLSIQVIDDCSTGGWNNGTCCADPPLQWFLLQVQPPIIITSPINHY